MGFGDIFGNIAEKAADVKDSLSDTLEELFAQKKVRVICAAVAALLVLIPILTVVIIAANKNSQKKPPAELFTPDKIADGDLFFPAEPDFLPVIIFEEKQKKNWTETDAARFWTNPLDHSKDVWKRELSDSVDKLLEGVP